MEVERDHHDRQLAVGLLMMDVAEEIAKGLEAEAVV